MLLTVPMGPLGANAYFLYRAEGGDALVVDPSDAEATLLTLREHRLHLTDILLTHRHFDHLAGAAEVKAATGARVWIHTLDADGLRRDDVCRADWMGGVLTPCEPTNLVNDGDTIDAAGYRLTVLHTPGHTAGGVCFVCEEEGLAFTGDTVFCEGVGRTDLPTGDMRELMQSLNRVLALPQSYLLYPGHGEATSVSHEARCNPMLRYRSNPWFN